MGAADVDVEPFDPDADPAGTIGRQLGRYELCFELASGGMATVFLARMSSGSDSTASFERLVALKLIHRHLAKNQDFVDMFLDEARIASRINHPNVCTVYDFGEERGTYYIALELLEGETIAHVMRTVSRSDDERLAKTWPAYVARIVADSAEGLHAAHELLGPRGEPLDVVHRDVSPQNLFLNYDGSVRLVDFGIARAANRVHHTATGTLKGKYAYMAPEQLVQRDVDRRVDVWALGVVLWEMLTRKRLFRRDTEFLTVKALQEMEIPGPSAIRSDVPAVLDPIVLKALRRDPEERYPTAREMGRELSRAVMTMGEPAGMPEVAELMQRTFPDQHVKRRTLVELARDGTREVPAAHLGDEASDTGNAVTAVTTKAVDTVPHADVITKQLATGATKTDADKRFSTADATTDVAAKRSGERRQTKLLAGGLFVAVTALVVVLGVVAMPDDVPSVLRDKLPDVKTEAIDPSALMREGDDEPEPSAQPEVATAPEVEPEVEVEPAPRAEPTEGMMRPAMRARPAGEGTVRLAAVGGWARVSSRGRALCDTPCSARLPAGRHVLVFQKFGTGEPVRRTAHIRADQTTTVSADLR